MAPLPSLSPPCQTADPWVFMSGAPCRRQLRRLCIAVRDVGSLSQASAERDVLAGHLIESDHEIIRRDSGSRDHAIIQRPQQSQSFLFRATGDERDLQYNQAIRIFKAQERRCMTKLAPRQN